MSRNGHEIGLEQEFDNLIGMVETATDRKCCENPRCILMIFAFILSESEGFRSNVVGKFILLCISPLYDCERAMLGHTLQKQMGWVTGSGCTRQAIQ